MLPLGISFGFLSPYLITFTILLPDTLSIHHMSVSYALMFLCVVRKMICFKVLIMGCPY